MTLKSEVYVSHGGAWEMVGTSYPEPIHNNTYNRDAVDAHPLISVSNLSAILDGKAVVGHTHTNHRISTVSAAAPANPAAGDMWCNSSTNAVQVWSGSTWMNPKFWLGTKWDNYRTPPVVPPPPSYTVSLEEAHYNDVNGNSAFGWGFDNDTQGWTSSYAPIQWRPGALVFYVYSTSGSSDYYYAAYFPHTQGAQYGARFVVSYNAHAGGSDFPEFAGNLYYYENGLVGSTTGRVKHRFSYPGEIVTLIIPPGPPSSRTEPSIQTYVTMPKATTGPAQTIIPQYWNGSAWIAQSAV